MAIEWEKAAISELQDLSAMRRSLKSIPTLIERQDSIIQRIRTTTYDSGRILCAGDGEGALLSAIVYRDELKLRLVEAKRSVDAVSIALEALDDKELNILEQTIIHPRKNAVSSLCEEYYVEPNTIYRWKRLALERFTKSLYGCK